MTIVEVLRKSRPGEGIRRESDLDQNFWLLPTDGAECIEMFHKAKCLSIRWNPTREDLLAVDWVVVKNPIKKEADLLNANISFLLGVYLGNKIRD